MLNTFPTGRGARVEAFGRHYTVEYELSATTIQAKDVVTNQPIELNIRDLAFPRDNLPSIEPEPVVADVKRWEEAKRRYTFVKMALDLPCCTRKDIKRIAALAGTHWTTLYRWIRRYRARRRVSVLMPHKPDGGSGKSRVSEDYETIIQTAIKNIYMTKQRKTVEATHEEVRRLCLAARKKAPAYSTVLRRINAIPEKERLKARGYRKEVIERFLPKPGTFEGAPDPLSFVECDHTQVDIVIVDEEFRQPIGSPYITFCIDVCTRGILGYYLSLDPVGRLSTSLALSHGILPKDKWLAELGLDYEWPFRGRPRILGVDNALEFDCPWLQVTGQDLGTEIDYRPVRQARYGAVIEAFNRTFKRAIHELPGATFSSIKQREGYDSEKESLFTLRELDIWIARWIAAVYHKKLHSGINTTPFQAWNDGTLGTATKRGIGLPDLEQDEGLLRVSLLPSVHHKVHPFGIVHNHIKYYSPILNSHIGRLDANRRKPKYLIRFDPRDLGTIYFFDPDLGQYFPVVYRTPHPSISMWEYNIHRARLRRDGQKHVDEHAIFEAKARNDEVLAKARALTKAERRQRSRAHNADRLLADRPQRPNLHAVPNVASPPAGANIRPREVEDWV